ncbi:MAG: hypothetical protein ACXVC6_11185 [Bacteroidia bacterium]
MKKIYFLITLFSLLTANKIVAQVDSLSAKPEEKTPIKADTLFTRLHEKIPCKVLEIGVSEIRYKKASFLEGPTFIIEKTRVDYIVFASGIKDIIQQEQPAPPVYQNNNVAPYISPYPRPSEMPIMEKTKAIKLEPMALLQGKFILGFEMCLKMGFNIEAKVGYVNSTVLSQSINHNSSFAYYGYYNYSKPVISAGFFKGGIKFTFEQAHKYKGLWYRHPLKGHFLRVNALANNLRVHYNQYLYQSLNGTTSSNYYPVDQTVIIYGLTGDYGYQFVMGSSVTLDMYLGLGYATYHRISNVPTYTPSGYYLNSYNQGSTYYSHTALGMPNNGTEGMIFNAGFTLGIALR